MCASSPFTPAVNDDLLENTLQRYQRTLGFASAFARAKKEELDILWQRRGAFGPRATEFVKRIDALAAKAAEGEAIVRFARGQATRQAFNALGTFDLNGLQEATQGLESMARELKAHPGIQAAMAGLLATPDPRGGTGPIQPAKAPTERLEGRPVTGRLAELMRAWCSPPAVLQAGPTPEEIQAKRAERAADQNKQALDAAIALVTKVLKSVSPRLHVMEVALEATGLPARARPWEAIEDEIPIAGEAAGFSSAQIGWLFHLADLYTSDPRAMQVAHMAIVQWGQARALLGEAETVRRTMANAPAQKSAELLRTFNLGRFRASVFPLSHLHMSFKGIALLQDLFPDPS